MELLHFGPIDVHQIIAPGEDERLILWNGGCGKFNGAAGAKRLVFVDVLDVDVWDWIMLEVFFDSVCFIADGEDDVVNVVSGEVFDDVLHGWFIFDREKGFGQGVG